MILILCEQDHLDRAQALQEITPGSHVLFADQTPMKGIGNVDTLIFWGHSAGAGSKFCEFTPEEFALRLAEWRHAQPQLENVETISCNLVHAWDQTLALTTNDSFIHKAKATLAGTKAWQLKIKTMPQALTGPGNYSILLWSANTKTWAYLGAHAGRQKLTSPGDHVLKQLEAFFRYQNPQPEEPVKRLRQNPNYVLLHQQFLQFANNNIPAHLTVMSGTIHDIRDLLVPL